MALTSGTFRPLKLRQEYRSSNKYEISGGIASLIKNNVEHEVFTSTNLYNVTFYSREMSL